MVLVRDLENFRGLIGEAVGHGLNAALRLLDVLLATNDLHLALEMYRALLLLADLFLLLLLLTLVREVDLDAKLVAQPVDACTTRTDDPPDVFAVDVELDRVAADDLVVLRGLDDLRNLLDGPVYVCADPTNDDNVLGRGVISIRTKLDGQSLVLADDTWKRETRSSICLKATYAFRVVRLTPSTAECQRFSTGTVSLFTSAASRANF